MIALALATAIMPAKTRFACAAINVLDGDLLVEREVRGHSHGAGIERVST